MKLYTDREVASIPDNSAEQGGAGFIMEGDDNGGLRQVLSPRLTLTPETHSNVLNINKQ